MGALETCPTLGSGTEIASKPVNAPAANNPRIIIQTMPSVCQNHAQNVTPLEYSWS